MNRTIVSTQVLKDTILVFREKKGKWLTLKKIEIFFSYTRNYKKM